MFGSRLVEFSGSSIPTSWVLRSQTPTIGEEQTYSHRSARGLGFRVDHSLRQVPGRLKLFHNGNIQWKNQTRNDPISLKGGFLGTFFGIGRRQVPQCRNTTFSRHNSIVFAVQFSLEVRCPSASRVGLGHVKMECFIRWEFVFSALSRPS